MFSTTMEHHLLLVSLYILTWSACTAETDPAVIQLAVIEDEDVVLPCSFGPVDITNKAFDWKKENVPDEQKEVFFYENVNKKVVSKNFQGRVFHFPDQLTSGDASIRIKQTKVADSGNYICVHAIQPPKTLSKVELTVGVCPKPFLKPRKTDGEVVLKCDVLGASPQPEVEIQDCDRNLTTAKDFTATVTEASHYRCILTQPKLCHQISSDCIWAAPVSDSPSSSGSVVVAALIPSALLLFYLC